MCQTLHTHLRTWSVTSQAKDGESVYVLVYKCQAAHDKEMDIYISSWLHFPGLSLMALCSGAVLLLPTYFMTSCAPHANNGPSPLSILHTLPSLTSSAQCFNLHCHYPSFFYFSCPALVQMPKTVLNRASQKWRDKIVLKLSFWVNALQLNSWLNMSLQCPYISHLFSKASFFVFSFHLA